MKLTQLRLALLVAVVHFGTGHDVSALPSGEEPGPSSLPGSRPNILVLMADDLDVTSMEVLLEQGLMPNLEQYVVGPGTTFHESFVTNAICCPSRATYLTGQYSHNHRTFSNTLFNGAVLAFDDGATLGTWLQTAGYRTAHVGKYVNAYGLLHSMEESPQLRDWVREQIRIAYPDTAERVEPQYVPPGWDGWYGLIDLSTYCVYDYSINENGRVRTYLRDGGILEEGTVVQEGSGGTTLHYQTDVLTDKAVEFLVDHWSRGDSRPFFLSVMPLAPHIEECQGRDPEIPERDSRDYEQRFQAFIRPAPRHSDRVESLTATARAVLPSKRSYNELELEDKPRILGSRLELLLPDVEEHLFSQFGHRLASMLAVDDLLGRLIRELETRGELERTLILFTSDNGWFNGEHRLSSKGLAYEEAIRVPLFVRLPGQTEAREEQRPVLNNDLAPTLLDLAGGTPTIPVDGRSLLPLLAGSAPAVWRQRFVIEHFSGFRPESRYRHVDPFNLFGIRTSAGSALPGRVYVEYYRGVQLADGYRRSVFPSSHSEGFVWQERPQGRELYSLSADPFQTENLLHNWLTRPDAGTILEEAASLQDSMLKLLVCAGAECQLLENQ